MVLAHVMFLALVMVLVRVKVLAHVMVLACDGWRRGSHGLRARDAWRAPPRRPTGWGGSTTKGRCRRWGTGPGCPPGCCTPSRPCSPPRSGAPCRVCRAWCTTGPPRPPPSLVDETSWEATKDAHEALRKALLELATGLNLCEYWYLVNVPSIHLYLFFKRAKI